MNRKAERLLAATHGLRKGSVLVEIGCVRTTGEVATDGYSTVYLARAAIERGWEFHSVDRDAGAVQKAQEAADGSVTLHCADGAEWLASFKRTIRFLYLDGSTSPEEAVAQYRAAKLSRKPVIVIDDVQQIGGQQRGKGDALLDVLEQDGFLVEIYDTEPGYRMAVAKR